MLKAEDFIKCKERKLKEKEKESAIREQLELVDKRLNYAYENLKSGKNIGIEYIKVVENLLPETIEELNKLGYCVEKQCEVCWGEKMTNYIYFEEPKGVTIAHLHYTLLSETF